MKKAEDVARCYHEKRKERVFAHEDVLAIDHAQIDSHPRSGRTIERRSFG